MSRVAHRPFIAHHEVWDIAVSEGPGVIGKACAPRRLVLIPCDLRVSTKGSYANNIHVPQAGEPSE